MASIKKNPYSCISKVKEDGNNKQHGNYFHLKKYVHVHGDVFTAYYNLFV